MTATTLTAPAKSIPTTRRRPRTSGRWTATRAAVRRWFTATQLGPVDNYVTR